MIKMDVKKWKEQIREMDHALRIQMRSRWHRDLPFEELLFNRWDRAKSLKFGDETSIYHNSYVYGDVVVGKNTWIGPLTLLDGTGHITIGDWCSISAGVQIYTHDTVNWALSGGRSPYEYAPVQIGSCCFIGSQSVIFKGVTIGEHTVIGAGSLVDRSIPPYSIAFGSPCRVRGRVEIDKKGKVKLIFKTVKNR